MKVSFKIKSRQIFAHKQIMLISSDLNEFETHKAVNTKAKQPSFAFEQIFKACEEEKSFVLHAAMNYSIQKLFEMVQRTQAEVDSQRTAKIYPIILQENQMQELPIFMGKIADRLYEKQRDNLPIFGHPSKEVLIIQKYGTDVREILLNIYEHFEKIQLEVNFKFYIYIINDVTDLSQENLYIFSKGITNKNFIAFIPTFQTFSEENYEAVYKLQIQKFVCSTYDPKQTFSKYIYNCIKSPKIRAYMPPDILNLVTDMNYYHLSYKQSCRRFNYCLLKSLQLKPSQRVQISIDKQISKIEEILKNKFKYKDYMTSWYNIIKVILDEQQAYKISHTAISVEISLRNGGMQYNSKNAQLSRRYESDFIQSLTYSFKKHLDKKQLAIFEQSEVAAQTTKGPRRQKRRIDKLLSKTQKIVDSKIQLENNITRVIKSLTKNVRKHAKSLKWTSFKFDQRIRPSIPMKIVDAIKEQNSYVEWLTQDITSNYYKPLSSLFSLFDEKDMGYALYLIKTLELSGLFFLSKKELNPSVFNNFFQKARFN